MRFKPTEIATIIVAGIALAGSVVSAFYTYTSRNRELDIKLVEIGIGILRADPKETGGVTAARGWAVQVIENYSRVRFSDEDRKALLESPLLYGSAIKDILAEREAREEILKQINQLKQMVVPIVPPPPKPP
jgi:hypothetical protein